MLFDISCNIFDSDSERMKVQFMRFNDGFIGRREVLEDIVSVIGAEQGILKSINWKFLWNMWYKRKTWRLPSIIICLAGVV